MRWGLGPVFRYECLANARRWQTYALRSIGVSLLLVAITSIAMSRMTFDPTRGWRQYAALGESYFYAIIGVELALVMLSAPAATAGAICVDRARGTLTHMLATDLSDAEIVLGKLTARLLPILGLVACSWPVLAVSSLLGGIDPTALTLAFAVILAVGLVGCTMALALSVWARKPHEVVLAVYTAWMIVLLLWPIWSALSRGMPIGSPPGWSLVANPYYLAFAPYSAPGRVGFWDYLGFFAATLGASVALIVLTVWRMRPVARRGTDEHRRQLRVALVGQITRRLPGPSLDGNPVLWREWHRSRPSPWLMVLVVLVGGGTGIACLFGVAMVWANGLTGKPGAPELIIGIGGLFVQLIFGLLMLSAVAPMSMSEERQRGSLDLLAVTSLSTPAIVLGKWLATLRLVALLLIGPGLLGFVLAAADKPPPTIAPGTPFWYYAEFSRRELLFGACFLVATIFVHGALIASVGLAAAVWIRRQSRAITLSVGFAVIVGAGWPLLILAGRMGPEGWGLMSLSPVAAIGHLVEMLTSRLSHSTRGLLWWIAFWDIECLALTLGLVWLTVRTFDRCFGRVAEPSARAPVLSDVVFVLAGLTGIGGLFGAIAIWVNGLVWFRSTPDFGAFICVVLTAVGFHLLAALVSAALSRQGQAGVMVGHPAAAISGWKLFAIRWWEAFRLVLLLAIGPGLVALALLTTPAPVLVAEKVTKLPGGGTSRIGMEPSGIIYVGTIDASRARTFREATAAEIAEVTKPVTPYQTRAGMLTITALAVVTILAHGAAFISLGAAIGVWIRRRDRAITASVGVVLFVTVGWPLLYLLYRDRGYPWGWTFASVIPAFTAVVFSMNRPEAIVAETTWWAGFWDLVMIVVAMIGAGLAIRALDRGCRWLPTLDEAHAERLKEKCQ